MQDARMRGWLTLAAAWLLSPAALAQPTLKIAEPAPAAPQQPPQHTQQLPPSPQPRSGMPAPPCIGELTRSARLRVPEGQSLLLDLVSANLPAPAWLRAIGSAETLQVEPMAAVAPRSSFFLFGKRVGATNLLFQDRYNRCALVDVVVDVDAAAVEASLRELLPRETGIRIAAAADALVLTGMASDAVAVERAVSLAGAFARRSSGNGGNGGNGGTSGTAVSGGERVVNMLTVAAPQQVMLEVKVAEISRTLLERLGVDVLLTRSRGNWSTRLSSAFGGTGSGVLGVVKTASGEFINIDAEKQDGAIRILAEPTITAISGQEGSFLAGGRVLIPVAQNSAGGGASFTLEEREFGVGLRFLPTVLDGGRINIRVEPEVSELSREGVAVSGGGSTSVLPLFTTRRAATTVQLRDGQSLAIGGLIRNTVAQNVRALPLLGEVPVLGALFRSSDFQNDRSELVFIITPRLAQALPEDMPLPTDRSPPPSRREFFLEGRMEGGIGQGDER
ncbi:type II and III secretion system protein family protein [Noviherbaspirillum pedocola]|uniref:Type IV pilus biogenesis and competence protein PilQ n=1 Tax=Noviherbaspirillum pedocola TaxID=2801341 RepID=A0A934W033_9BURK|nr:type II and III secretion system protein family protein [Noviherbaspirillum pedocola]MBK4733661.1 type II and III secretion system protein family protein [Noviherbaspirillum pedocola]